MAKEKIVKSINKIQKEKKEEKIKKYSFRKFFFGVGKEYKRITWLTKKQLFYNFMIAIAIIIIFAAIFTGISLMMVRFVG